MDSRRKTKGSDRARCLSPAVASLLPAGAVAHIRPVPYEYAVPDYPLYLYPFKYRDPLTGKWRRARYAAERHVIRERHGEEFEITGEPMVIQGPIEGWFNPGTGNKG